MKQPSLSQAPLGWLEAVVRDTTKEKAEYQLDITIQSLSDHQLYVFSYVLSDIRAELERRQHKGFEITSNRVSSESGREE